MFCDAISWLAFNHRPSDTMTSTATDSHFFHCLTFLLTGLPFPLLRSIIWSIPYGNSITLCDLLRLRTIYEDVNLLIIWLHSDARLSKQLANYLIMKHFSRSHETPITQLVGENLMLHCISNKSFNITFLFRSTRLRSSPVQMWFIRRWWREIAYH